MSAKPAARVFLEQRRRIRLARLANIEAPVRHNALGRGQLTRANIHAFINLHGVGRYHFPIYATCDFLRDIGFARRRRPHNNDNGLRQLKGWLLARLRASTTSPDKYQVSDSSMRTFTMVPSSSSMVLPAGNGRVHGHIVRAAACEHVFIALRRALDKHIEHTAGKALVLLVGALCTMSTSSVEAAAEWFRAALDRPF